MNIIVAIILLLISLVVVIVLKYRIGKKKKILRHVVLFKFSGDTKSEKTKEFEEAFLALPKKIIQIKNFEWGTNSSPENLSQGFSHCFFMSFQSNQDRDDYLVHPDHKKFGELLRPSLDKVLVIDYWIQG